jgi:hypothetical protein
MPSQPVTAKPGTTSQVGGMSGNTPGAQVPSLRARAARPTGLEGW